MTDDTGRAQDRRLMWLIAGVLTLIVVTMLAVAVLV
jgi:hypothetical protein